MSRLSEFVERNEGLLVDLAQGINAVRRAPEITVALNNKETLVSSDAYVGNAGIAFAQVVVEADCEEDCDTYEIVFIPWSSIQYVAMEAKGDVR